MSPSRQEWSEVDETGRRGFGVLRGPEEGRRCSRPGTAGRAGIAKREEHGPLGAPAHCNRVERSSRTYDVGAEHNRESKEQARDSDQHRGSARRTGEHDGGVEATAEEFDHERQNRGHAAMICDR